MHTIFPPVTNFYARDHRVVICKSLLLAKVGRIPLEWLPRAQLCGSVQVVPLDGDCTQTFDGERVLESYEYIESAQLFKFQCQCLL